MSNNTAHTSDSALAKINLGFEYDISWAAAKKALKERTL